MHSVLFSFAAAIAAVSVWLAFYGAPSWALKSRIAHRLKNREGLEEGESLESLFAVLTERFVNLSAVRSDYIDMERALETTGRSRLQSQSTYIGLCWFAPAVSILFGFFIFGVIGGSIVAAAAFLLPRRVIRSMGENAEKQQNLEAVELCHMTRMLMEAGLSIERTLKLVAVQARPIMPGLAGRLDRFNRLMESGADRTVALDELGRNRRIKVLRNYVSLMKQSGSLGAGVSSSLDQIILEAQQTERSRLKEATNRIGAKMTIVMMVFMLPGLFMLIGGPAIMSIADNLGQ